MSETIHDQITAARALIRERGIDFAAARLAYKSMHPQIKHDQIDLALTMEVGTISKLLPPFTVDSVAEQIANRSGAYPWDGPVGNGFTVAEYQERFRAIARDTVFLMGQLGFLDADR